MINHDTLRGLTQKRLHANPWRWVRFPVASEDAEEQETLFLEGTTADGAAQEGKRFATPNGKLQFWSKELDENFRTMGLSALPVFYSEREQLIDLPYVQSIAGDDDDGIMTPFHPNTLGVPGRIVTPNDETPGAKLRAEGYDMELVTGRRRRIFTAGPTISGKARRCGRICMHRSIRTQRPVCRWKMAIA